MENRLQTLHEAFLKDLSVVQKKSDSYVQDHKKVFETFMKLQPGLNDPTKVTYETILEFFSTLETRERLVGKKMLRLGVKKSTIATYWSRLHVFFKWMEGHQYVSKDPFIGVKFPKVYYDDRKFMKAEDVRKIIQAIAFTIEWSNAFLRKRNLAIMYVLLFCGLRRGELLGLRAHNLNFERKTVTVPEEISKSRVSRDVSLTDQTIMVLRDYLDARQKKHYQTESLFVADNHDGPLTVHGLKHLVKRIIAETKVKFHLHRLRHTFGVNYIHIGGDIAELKQLLGHRDIRMTATYLRCLPTDMMQEKVNKLNLDNLV